MYNRVLELLRQEPILRDFRYLKSQGSFKMKISDGWYEIGLVHSRVSGWQMRALDGSKVLSDFLEITPYASRRFNILWEWYEEYVRTDIFNIRDFRNKPSVVIGGRDYGIPDDFFFCLDGSNFEKEYHRLYLMIEDLMERIFDYATLKNVYDRDVKKYLIESPDKYINGIQWFLGDMLLGRIVDPDNYSILRETMQKHMQELKKRGEPNYEYYEPKIPEIISKLERVGDEYRAKYKPSPEIDHDPIWDTIQARLKSQSNH